MDDYLLMKFLESQEGNGDMIDRFKKFIMKDRYARGGGSSSNNRRGGSSRRHQDFEDFEEYDTYERRRNLDDFDEFYARGGGRNRRYNSPKEFIDEYISNGGSEEDLFEEIEMREMRRGSGGSSSNRRMSHMGSQHFDVDYARFLVSKMYHIEDGRKYVGEKYDISKAKEVCERYKGMIPQSATHADVYVAINAQYHDYCELFKSWFGDNIDQKIIESAIVFWFKDDDYKGVKIWKYFKEEY